ncbi:MAG TPA: hypothetical protein VFI36_10810 [Arthrobacter sp.]|nr:hypothetical protein [Arthrobacter sp.]
MSIRHRGKRLASGITVAVSVGSLATAGVAAAAVYSATPSVVARTGATTSGSSTSGSSTSGGSAGSTPDTGTRHSRSYTGTSPVQPGNGSVTHGRSSGS